MSAVATIDFDGIGSNGSMPFSEDCEKGLLGSILKSPIEVLEKCRDQLSADTFYIPARIGQRIRKLVLSESAVIEEVAH